MVAGGGPKVGKGEQKGKLLGPKRNQEKGRSQKVWQRKPKGVPMAPFAAHVGVPLGALDRRWPRPGPGAGHPTPPENAFINFLAVLGPVVPQRPKQHQKKVGAGGSKKYSRAMAGHFRPTACLAMAGQRLRLTRPMCQRPGWPRLAKGVGFAMPWPRLWLDSQYKTMQLFGVGGCLPDRW